MRLRSGGNTARGANSMKILEPSHTATDIYSNVPSDYYRNSRDMSVGKMIMVLIMLYSFLIYALEISSYNRNEPLEYVITKSLITNHTTPDFVDNTISVEEMNARFSKISNIVIKNTNTLYDLYSYRNENVFRDNLICLEYNNRHLGRVDIYSQWCNMMLQDMPNSIIIIDEFIKSKKGTISKKPYYFSAPDNNETKNIAKIYVIRNMY